MDANTHMMHANDMYCEDCGATIEPGSACVNVGDCLTADTAASKLATGETAKARMSPAAWTRAGNID